MMIVAYKKKTDDLSWTAFTQIMSEARRCDVAWSDSDQMVWSLDDTKTSIGDIVGAITEDFGPQVSIEFVSISRDGVDLLRLNDGKLWKEVVA